jgi:Protein of unknown function (DUF2695)
MAKGAEKRRRRSIVHALNERAHADAEARRPSGKPVLRDLLAHLEAQLLVRTPEGHVATRCDRTLTLTKAFLRQGGVWNDSLIDWFAEYGGFCDCEVMYNVFDYWTPERLSD